MGTRVNCTHDRTVGTKATGNRRGADLGLSDITKINFLLKVLLRRRAWT